jgi:hypothetical protein
MRPRPSVVEARLAQPGAAKALQIVFAVGFQFPGQLGCDPGQRDVGLRAAQFGQCGGRDLGVSGHAGGDRQYPVGAGQIAALPDGVARKRNRLGIVSPDKLGIGGDAVIDCQRRIARRLPDGALRGNMRLPPPPAIGQGLRVLTLRQRKIRI